MKVARAFAWEFWCLARVRLLSTFGGVACLVALSYSLSPPTPGKNEHELFFSMFWISLIAFVAVIMQCREDPSGPLRFEPRLYRLPVSTPALVGWKILPPTIASGVLYVETAGVIYVAFGFKWPVWGPLFFVLTVMALGQALAWALSGVPIVRSLVSLVAMFFLLVWFSARFGVAGGPFGQPTRMWWVPTVGEGLTLLGMIGVAFALAVVGVSRDRRGDAWTLRGWLVGLTGLAQVLPRRKLPRRKLAFHSPTSAQLWFEWRQKGWVMPLYAAVSLVVVVAMNSIDGLSTGGILRSLFLVLGFILVAFPTVIGAIMGRFSLSSDEPGLGLFRATRPLSDTQLARVLLQAGAASLLLSWVVAFSGLAAAFGLLHKWGDREKVELIWSGLVQAAEHLGLVTTAGIFLLVLALGWMNMALVAAIFLTGRNWIPGVLVFLPYALVAGYFVLPYLPPSAVPVLIQVGSWAVGLGGLAVTVIGFAAARRHRLLGPSVPWSALTFWSLASLGAAFYRWDLLIEVLGSGVALERSFIVVGLGLLALMTAPMALAPLALAWNRHR